MDSSADLLLQASRDALWACIYASMPLLIPILVVGLIVGIVQAATSVNEQTLSFVPKLAVTALVLVIGGATIMGGMVAFTHTMIERIALVVR